MTATPHASQTERPWHRCPLAWRLVVWGGFCFFMGAGGALLWCCGAFETPFTKSEVESFFRDGFGLAIRAPILFLSTPVFLALIGLAEGLGLFNEQVAMPLLILLIPGQWQAFFFLGTMRFWQQPRTFWIAPVMLWVAGVGAGYCLL